MDTTSKDLRRNISELKICRICLVSDTKLYRFDCFKLLYYYEELTSLSIADLDGLPNYFCYECAILLQKCCKFKKKCYAGLRTLKDMLKLGPITYENIHKIDRVVTKLTSPLKVLRVNKRVKTYTFINEENTDEYSKSDVNVEPLKKESDRTSSEYEDNNISDVETINQDPLDEEEISPTISCEKNKAIDLSSWTDTSLYIHKEKQAKVIFKTEIKQSENVTKTEELFCNNDTITKEADTSKTKKRISTEIIENNVNISKKPYTSKTTARKKCKSKKIPKLKKVLNPNHWKTIRLSEEEALEQHKSLAEDLKYLAAAYKCVSCCKGFSEKDMLTRHIKSKHCESLGPFECKFCKMRFKLDCYLSKHKGRHYARFECLRCDLVCCLETSASLHDEKHNGVLMKCKHCNREYRHRSTYYTHLRTHKSKHMCSICGESFVSQLGLHMHQKAKHVDMQGSNPSAVLDTNCDVCHMKFKTKEAYDKHLLHSSMHTKDGEKDPARKKLSRSKRNSNMDSLSEDRNFFRKPTTCHQCGKHFKTQAACMKHHLSQHPRTSFFAPNERVICEICGASLAPGSVATHLNQHTRRKIYTCDTCGRSFTSSSLLQKHFVTHTGEKKFACTLCDKRFTQNGSLSLHYRTFHLKQPYPKRNRQQNIDKRSLEIFEEQKK